MTAVIVLLPLLLLLLLPLSSSPISRVADLRGISAPRSSPSDQRSRKKKKKKQAPETHRSAPPRLLPRHESTRPGASPIKKKKKKRRRSGEELDTSAKFPIWIFFSFFFPPPRAATLILSSDRLQILFSPLFFSPPLSLSKAPLTPFSSGFSVKKDLYTYIPAPFDSSPGGCHPIRRLCKMCPNGL